jgi:hypothetical protein
MTKIQNPKQKNKRIFWNLIIGILNLFRISIFEFRIFCGLFCSGSVVLLVLRSL